MLGTDADASRLMAEAPRPSSATSGVMKRVVGLTHTGLGVSLSFGYEGKPDETIFKGNVSIRECGGVTRKPRLVIGCPIGLRWR
jgi:hypothetical protein